MTRSANRVVRSLILGLLLTLYCGPGHAADSSAPPARALSRAALLDLARKFVAGVENANAVTAAPEAAPKKAARLSEAEKIERAFNALEDGEVLLLNLSLTAGRARDTVHIKDPILAVKEGQDVMISLSEFIAVARFAIRVDSETGRAQGWFIRENKTFALDAKAGQVQIEDQVLPIPEGAVRMENDDILVRGKVLAEWFDFDMTVNPQRQIASVDSEQKWPVEEQIDRMNRAKSLAGRQPPPRQPRLVDPIRQASVPNIDINTRERLTKAGDGDRTIKKTADFNVRTAGDLLGHTAEGFFIGDAQERLTSGRLTMSQYSEEPDLLGPLKARSYSFLDVATTPVPYAGSASFESGFRVSNKDPFTTFDATTTLNGEGQPGWDVELYRGDQFIDSTKVEPDGRFEFTDVILFAEDNDFRIVQYGEQGEIREDNRTISVKPRTFNNENGAYDVSVSFSNTQLYTKEKTTDTDRYQPHIAATYDYQLSQNLALRSGLQAQQEEGTDRLYLQGGAVESYGRTVFNQDVVVNNEGSWTAALAGRHNIDKHNMYGTLEYESKDYNPGSDQSDPSELKLRVNARGPLPDLIGTRNRYGVSGRYELRGDDSARQSLSANYGGRVKKIGYNNKLSHQVATNTDGSTRERDNYGLMLNGAALGLTWRGTADYNIYPESQMESYAINLRKKFSETVSSELEMEYLPPTDFWISTLSTNWRTKHAMISPTLVYDSDNNISAILRTSMGLTYNPYANDLLAVSEDVSNRGGLSARVFLDKNGDNIFNNDDQLIEGALVRAIHARKQAETDANGEAYIYNLPIGKLTDVTVLEGSMFEPSWIPATPGVSVRPRAGHISRVDFPLVNSGEVDGTLYIESDRDKPRLLRDITIRLTDGSGRVVQETRTANDGFYLFTKIPPGRYYIIPDKDDLRASRASALPPRPIDIGYDGTIIYGNDITYPSGPGIGLTMISAEDFRNSYPGHELEGAENIVLNLGSYNSPLTSALVWYRLKTRYTDIVGGLTPLFRMGDEQKDARNGLYTLRLKLPSADGEDAFRRCRALAARGISCLIEYLPGAGVDEVASALP